MPAAMFDSVPQALDALRRGGFVVVMDDEGRENEGDLVLAAEFATQANVAFMVRHTNGLLCTTMPAARAAELDLPPMVPDNEDRNGTAFTVSCDVRKGTTTGASASDRAMTARSLADPSCTAADFARPGHMFPLVARPGLLAERQGHTEASVQLCVMAALQPVGLICELMAPDGTMMRRDACREFAQLHGLPIITTEQIVDYYNSDAFKSHWQPSIVGADGLKLASKGGAADPAADVLSQTIALSSSPPASAGPLAAEPLNIPFLPSTPAGTMAMAVDGQNLLAGQPAVIPESPEVQLTAECALPVRLPGREAEAQFRLLVFRNTHDDEEHLVVVKGDVAGRAGVLTRVHSECHTGNILGSLRCDCGPQLEQGLAQIADKGEGVFIYLRGHEGRGIGLTNKIRAYKLQDRGLDTYAANQALNLPTDRRNYDVASNILRALRVASVALMTNNPAKVKHLGVQVDEVIPLLPAPTSHSAGYLRTKRERESMLWSELKQHAAARADEHLLEVLEQRPQPAAPTASQDEVFMQRALALAERGRASAPPNPWVGCVIVDTHGRVIGEGYHHRAGQSHAEVNALQSVVASVGGDEAKAAVLLRGATVYCTLEPCHHTGRTGPCDQALIRWHVGRVVIGVVDPDSRVASAGVAHLRASGIEVTVGVCGAQVEASLRPYLHCRVTGRPYVVVKTALSVDGSLACADGSSQWITGPTARCDAHKLRARSQAVMLGSGTALADNPRLTARLDPGELSDAERDELLAARPRSLRVLLDSRGRVTSGHLLDTTEADTLVVTGAGAAPAARTAWAERGVEVAELAAGADGSVALEPLLDLLGKRGVIQVMVEGGATLQGALLAQNLVDEVHVYHGPTVLGKDSRSWMAEQELAPTIAAAKHWRLRSVRPLGDDTCTVYEARPSSYLAHMAGKL